MAARSNAERRRFLASQKSLHPDCPPQLWQRFVCFIDNAWDIQDVCPIKTFNEWVTT